MKNKIIFIIGAVLALILTNTLAFKLGMSYSDFYIKIKFDSKYSSARKKILVAKRNISPGEIFEEKMFISVPRYKVDHLGYEPDLKFLLLGKKAYWYIPKGTALSWGDLIQFTEKGVVDRSKALNDLNRIILHSKSKKIKNEGIYMIEMPENDH